MTTTNPVTITTPAGRVYTTTAHTDAYGRVVYQVADVGAFTIEPSEYDHAYVGRIKVTFGRREGVHRPQLYWYAGDDLPDLPVINRVTLVGCPTVRVDDMRPDRHHWLNVYRTGGGNAPVNTARRAAGLMYTLITDWQARPDHHQLLEAHARSLAPARLAAHDREIGRYRTHIAEQLACLAAEHRGRTIQTALLDQPDPTVAAPFPNPTSRDGQAILQLHATLAEMARWEKELPGADVVTAVEQWFQQLNLPLPDTN